MKNKEELKNNQESYNSFVMLIEFIKQKTKEYKRFTTILSKGDNVYKNALIRVFISLMIGYFLFIYSQYSLINPGSSIGMNFLDDIFNFRYKYQDFAGCIFFIIFSLSIYIVINLLYSQAKYTRIALNIDTKFKNIYNFHMSESNKDSGKTITVVYTVLFEGCRKEYLDSNELEQLLRMLHETNSIHSFIFKNEFKDFYDFNTYKSIYLKYNDYRAKNYNPLLSTMLSFAEIAEGKLDEEQIIFFKKEIEDTKLVSDEVQW
ncbi:hypothetical protein [Aliarcobacter cryaerophilus]|uniref:hypothetical protein n=1 Tax=Aliarcobacter cryaerophilus TaxID=28198 RepID=UPI003DA65338